MHEGFCHCNPYPEVEETVSGYVCSVCKLPRLTVEPLATQREMETHYMRAHSVIVNNFNPTPEQWQEFEEAEKALKAIPTDPVGWSSFFAEWKML